MTLLWMTKMKCATKVVVALCLLLAVSVLIGTTSLVGLAKMAEGKHRIIASPSLSCVSLRCLPYPSDRSTASRALL